MTVKDLVATVKEVLMDCIVLVLVTLVGLIGAILVWAGDPSGIEVYYSLAMMFTPVILIISSVKMCILQYFALAFLLVGTPFAITEFSGNFSGVKGIGFLILAVCQIVSLCCTRYLWSKLPQVPENLRTFASIFALVICCLAITGCGLILSEKTTFEGASIAGFLLFAYFLINELINIPFFSEVLLFLLIQYQYSTGLIAINVQNLVHQTECIIGFSLLTVASFLAQLVIIIRLFKGSNRRASLNEVVENIATYFRDHIKSLAVIVALVSVVITVAGAVFVLIKDHNSTAIYEILYAAATPTIALFAVLLHPSVQFVVYGMVYAILPGTLAGVAGEWTTYTGFLCISIGLILSLLCNHNLFSRREEVTDDLRANPQKIALILFSAVFIWVGCIMQWSQLYALRLTLLSTSVDAFIISLAVFVDALFGFDGLRQTIIFAIGVISFSVMTGIISGSGPILTSYIFIFIGGFLLVALYAWKSYGGEEQKETGTETERANII